AVCIIQLYPEILTYTSLFLLIRGISYHCHGQSSCICIRLFRSQCNRIAPSLREHICITLDRLSVNKYWGTGS
ncbi:MAG: hypothetical protein K2M19_04165, partial [Muribaculaceae bacterium]|nr:hypothetical protein [Muribaculaceae bacterium]